MSGVYIYTKVSNQAVGNYRKLLRFFDQVRPGLVEEFTRDRIFTPGYRRQLPDAKYMTMELTRQGCCVYHDTQESINDAMDGSEGAYQYMSAKDFKTFVNAVVGGAR